MTRWWVRRGENTFGPLEVATIVAALRDGRIEPGDLACKEGGRDWMLVTSIPEVAETFAPKRSQPPPEQDPWTEAAWMVGDLDGEILVGPVSLEEVKRDVAAGNIPGGSLLARVGSSAWRPMSDIFEEEMKTGVRANPLTMLQQMQLQQALQQQIQPPAQQQPPRRPLPPAPQQHAAQPAPQPQPPTPQPPAPRRPSQPPPQGSSHIGTPLPVARASAAPPPPTKPPGPPPRRRTQVIVGPEGPGAGAAPQSPPNAPQQRPSTPPRPPPQPPQAHVAPPPMVPRPATTPPPLPKRAANRRTLVEGVSMPDASEATMSPGDGLEWWVSRDGAPVGPLTTEQVREGLTHGAIDAQTNVCRADQQQWRPAATFTELTGSKPPPLPPRR